MLAMEAHTAAAWEACIFQAIEIELNQSINRRLDIFFIPACIKAHASCESCCMFQPQTLHSLAALYELNEPLQRTVASRLAVRFKSRRTAVEMQLRHEDAILNNPRIPIDIVVIRILPSMLWVDHYFNLERMEELTLLNRCKEATLAPRMDVSCGLMEPNLAPTCSIASVTGCEQSALRSDRQSSRPLEGVPAPQRKRSRTATSMGDELPSSQADSKRRRVEHAPSDFDTVAPASDPALPTQSWYASQVTSTPPPVHSDNDHDNGDHGDDDKQSKLYYDDDDDDDYDDPAPFGAPGSSPPSSPHHTLIPPSSPPGDAAPSPFPTPLFTVKDLSVKFQEAMLRYTAAKILEVADSCVYHTVLNQEPNVEHYGLLPRMLVGHEHAQAIKCDDERLCDWIKGLAYVIWRTEALRRVIFPAVGRGANDFPTSRSYKLWLSKRPAPTLTLSSNLLLVAWAYFKADDAGVLPQMAMQFDALEPPH
ncbi:hypothetical protein EDD18DRAFT_1357430 [Armillaria luteobubalina]|uniref:Uncharacterized protein n=1 Tax=Armillaria luteobubalina TaxID=153913 RepID=A0AA39UQI7_9AGAR|nr:hypothetical protein EDD18DRAFT_1357430 [Armillaria luteobubalina]